MGALLLALAKSIYYLKVIAASQLQKKTMIQTH